MAEVAEKNFVKEEIGGESARRLEVCCGHLIAKGLKPEEIALILRRGDCRLVSVDGCRLTEEVKIEFTSKRQERCPSIALDLGEEFGDLPVRMEGSPIGHFMVSSSTR